MRYCWIFWLQGLRKRRINLRITGYIETSRLTVEQTLFVERNSLLFFSNYSIEKNSFSSICLYNCLILERTVGRKVQCCVKQEVLI